MTVVEAVAGQEITLLAEEAGSQLATRFAVLEGALAECDPLAGADFGLVDLNVAAVCSWVELMHYDLADCPRLRAWLERCLARPAAKRVSAMS